MSQIKWRILHFVSSCYIKLLSTDTSIMPMGKTMNWIIEKQTKIKTKVSVDWELFVFFAKNQNRDLCLFLRDSNDLMSQKHESEDFDKTLCVFHSFLICVDL